MTSTKYEKFLFEHELSAEEMKAQCPLLAFLVEFSLGNHSAAYAIADGKPRHPHLFRHTTRRFNNL